MTAGVEIDLTCDGTDKSKFGPTGRSGVWNTTTNNGTLIADRFYSLDVIINITGTINNTSIVIGFENISDPLDRFERELLLERSGVAATLEASFKFFSEGSVFKITALADKNATINDVVFLEESKFELGV